MATDLEAAMAKLSGSMDAKDMLKSFDDEGNQGANQGGFFIKNDGLCIKNDDFVFQMMD